MTRRKTRATRGGKAPAAKPEAVEAALEAEVESPVASQEEKAGVLAAEDAGMPLLFWAMNGHPLGCT